MSEIKQEESLTGWLDDLGKQILSEKTEISGGTIRAVTGTVLRTSLKSLKLGELCELVNPWDDKKLYAEVVGFDPDGAILVPLGDMIGISSNTLVIPQDKVHHIQVGEPLLGKVLDGLGNPLSKKEKLPKDEMEEYAVQRPAPCALSRSVISNPLSLGVRAVDTLITCGEGQRLGILAEAGVGKSTLLAQIVKSTESEIVVLGLIGERGREVREFIDRDLGPQAMKKSVVVVSTSERPPMEKLKAAYVATAVAEYFRDQGKKVLLLVDSLTRFARAQREVGLASGEPPTRRGFPPSVFTVLPQLLERAGCSDRGSITALYTVLSEDSEQSDPIVEEAMSLLDGHIRLSRDLASKGHYPAIDVQHSISRVMNAIMPQKGVAAALKIREWLSKYEEVELLIRMGEYKAGVDMDMDMAVSKNKSINEFLMQKTNEKAKFVDSWKQILELSGANRKR